MKRLKLIRELFPLTKGYRTTYFLNFFLVIISGIMKISTPFFVLQVFDVAITKLRFDSLIFYTMLIVITTAIGSICEILYQRNISKFNRTLVIKLRSRCFEHINKLSGNFMSNYNSGDLFTTMYRDIEEIPSILTTSLFNFNCISNYIVSCPKILQQENRTSNNFNPQCNRKIEQLCSRNDWQFIFLL